MNSFNDFNSAIRKIIPIDPPMTPMKLTRQPIVDQFWLTGLVGLFAGFLFGFMLWLWQQGIVDAPEDYFSVKFFHARIQILLFTGSFLLGFALQAGPHVIGGQPPDSKTILSFLPILWIGTALSLVDDPGLMFIGNLLISVAFAGPAVLLFKITLFGQPHLRIPRGVPIALAFFLLSVAPWLELDNPDTALFVLWCGPVTAILVAAQQLTNNVLGGRLLQGKWAVLFISSLYMAWLTTAMAAFMESASWSLSGFLWLTTLLIQVQGTGFLQAALSYRFSSIQVTLLLAFIGLICAALMPLIMADLFLTDAAVHLLGVGVITLLVLGVAARVAGFFSGKNILPDRALTFLLLAWTILAAARTLSPFGISSPAWTHGTLQLGFLLLIIWTIPMINRLIEIGQQYKPEQSQEKQTLFK
ncbi:MAG: NnrS family protein [Magnetococcales bacterium]|nr:NnrS family protein [Magnetococcales bacterium]